MSESRLPNPEGSIAEQLSSLAYSAHESFLEIAPGYDRGVWIPHDAIQRKAGSCAAEAFFAAHKLIESGIVTKFVYGRFS